MGALDLAGTWRVRPDPDNRGLRDGWRSLANWPGTHGPGAAGTIEIPGPMQRALGPEHRGVAWIARKIRVPWPAREGERVWIRFESAATDATVWVNGREVGRHVGDYVPFQFDISSAVAGSAEAEIVVRIDQMHAPRPAPGSLTEHGHITKGFHDVLSIQHSGVWCGVSLRRTGLATIAPHGLQIRADAGAGRVNIRGELLGRPRDQHVRISVTDPRGRLCGTSTLVLEDEQTSFETWVMLANGHEISAWSPDEPNLYELTCELVGGEVKETRRERLAFRTVTTDGRGRILLNGEPILIRGVLHWGHEPERMSPAPTPEQARAEFAKLKELGFNCVCLCMWYAPEHYYDIADEVGMLIWQEHPVWKSRMGPEAVDEYKRMFEAFFRRDARHPSVVIVSGSCEHESFDRDLAAWWWVRAKEMLPGTLAQVQTAFMEWTDPAHTDLHDEHVYDNSGRWVRFVHDVEMAIRALPPPHCSKPFIMGETIIATAWADTTPRQGPAEWWHPRGVDECRVFEDRVRDRYGEATLERFRSGAHAQNLAIRKFQSEALRSFGACGGWVMNQIRDVPVGRLGFMDDDGRWRFAADELRPWLADVALLFRTPGWLRGLAGGRPIACELGVSNFGRGALDGEVSLVDATTGTAVSRARVRCEAGSVSWATLDLDLPEVTRPRVLELAASGTVQGSELRNRWSLVILPEVKLPEGIVRFDSLPFTSSELAPDFEDRAYSSGWGLTCRSWAPILPRPTDVAPDTPTWGGESRAGTVITHRLTEDLIDYMASGGRVVLLANKTRTGLGAKFINVWGQCPLIPEDGPLGPGDAAWIATLLHLDLLDRHPRAIPVEELGIADLVDPIIRLVFTHDRGVPKLFDGAFRARVGKGLLLASSLDVTTAAGRCLTRQLIAWSAMPTATTRGELNPGWLKAAVGAH